MLLRFKFLAYVRALENPLGRLRHRAKTERLRCQTAPADKRTRDLHIKLSCYATVTLVGSNYVPSADKSTKKINIQNYPKPTAAEAWLHRDA